MIDQSALMATFDCMFNNLCQTLQAEGRVDTISKQFSELGSDRARVASLLNIGAAQKTLEAPDIQRGKSSTLASQHKSKGNKHFHEKNYKQALRSYNSSIATAPHFRDANDKKSNDLSLAFANRSATLFHLKQWNDCLEDIKHALDSGYPSKLQHKLLTRRGQCVQHLGQKDQAISAYQQASKSVSNPEIDRQQQSSLIRDIDTEIERCNRMEPTADVLKLDCDVECDKTKPQISCSNLHFPSLSAVCDVAYHPDKGRHLVANTDVEAGELILVEKPYASVKLPACDTNCHHCYRYTYSLVPCVSCSAAVYCSEECRQTSMATYHQYECGLLPIIHQSGVGKFGHLAVRTVFVLGYDSVLKYKEDLESRKSPDSTEDPANDGCNSEGIYSPQDYRTIHSLVTHDGDRNVHDLFRRTAMAVFLLRCAMKAGFFPTSCDTDVKVFVGGLILSHLQSFPCNAHEITELELNRPSVATSTPLELGAGIYSSLSLFNHSCDPCVNRNFYGDISVMRAIKSIKKGQEISDNYGAVYATHTKAERLEKLKPQYFFECRCEPCLEDWPLYPDIPHKTPQWKCDHCQSPLHSASSGQISCPKCKTPHDISAKTSSLHAAQQQYEAAFEQLLACDVCAALPVFLRCLRELVRLVCPPWRDVNNCQEAIKQCYSIMGNCHPLENS